MPEESCQHDWAIVNTRNGYIVTEGCAHCSARLSFFSLEDTPPIDSYADGDHIWKYLGSAQAVKFDLKCALCEKPVNLDGAVGLMLCTLCNPKCNAGKLSNLVGKEKTWVYVALCADSCHVGGKCVGVEETKALTEYFNSKIKTPEKNILFVPCSFIINLDTCQGEVIADKGLTAIY